MFDTLLAVLPPLLLILAVLGSIFFGIATPTEASGLGAFGATLLAAANGRLSWKTMRETVWKTTLTTSFIFGIFLGATMFAVVLRQLGGDEFIAHSLRSIPFGPNGIVLVILGIAFVAGFFLDWLEISLIILPLVAPVIIELGFSEVWFVVLFAVTLQTSFLTPPVGFSLFYLKGVAPPGGHHHGHIPRGAALRGLPGAGGCAGLRVPAARALAARGDVRQLSRPAGASARAGPEGGLPMTDMPVLEKRRVQAEVIGPIYREMAAEIGAERAQAILGAAIRKAAVAEAARFRAGVAADADVMESFVALYDLWMRGGALEVEVLARTPERFDFDVTRCRYAEMYREMGLEDIGHLLSCARDGAFAEGFDPDLALDRAQTIMGGAPCCTFRYARGRSSSGGDSRSASP